MLVLVDQQTARYSARTSPPPAQSPGTVLVPALPPPNRRLEADLKGRGGCARTSLCQAHTRAAHIRMHTRILCVLVLLLAETANGELQSRVEFIQKATHMN